MIPLGHRTHLATKVQGEISMFGKAGNSEATKRLAGRGPDGMVKARPLEPRCPIWKERRPETVANIRGFQDARWIPGNQNGIRCPALNTLHGSRATVSSQKDTNRAPRAVLNVTRARNAGSPHRREPHGDGASVIVRGRESRPRGEGRQVDRNERTPGEARCFRLHGQPDRSRLPGTGEPDASKGCAAERGVESLTQSGGARRDAPGSSD